jgi:hypothetical protein
MHYEETEFGFSWGSAKVERICSDNKKGWINLSIETQKHPGSRSIQIYVTKSGKVRIFDGAAEWTPPKKNGGKTT